VTSIKRNPKLLRAAQGQACQWCGRDDGTTVAAHSNQQKHGKGMGIKALDRYIAFLCRSCHHAIDQGSFLSKEERRLLWDTAHQRTLTILVGMGLLEADDQGAGQANPQGTPAIREGADVHPEADPGL